jgi:two-component system, OmpR family, sensor histidine kinase SenX3
MRPRFQGRFWWTAAVVLMATVLVVLGVLQYRWSSAVSEAATVRMKAGLQASVWGFRQELHHDFAGLCPLARGPASSGDLATQLSEWEGTAEHGDLIAHIYVWRGVGGPHPRLQRFDPATHQLADAEWPAELVPLSQWLEHASGQMSIMVFGRGPRSGERETPDRSREERRGRPHFIMRRAAPPCMVDESVPGLIRHLPTAREDHPAAAGAPQDWMVVALDPRAVSARLLPELTARYFGGANGLEFDVAVLGGPEGRPVIYTTDAAFDPHSAPLDAQAPLFGFPGTPPEGGGAPVLTPPSQRSTEPTREARETPGLVRFGALDRTYDNRDWVLVVRHRNGTLEQTVARARRRNLTVSFGILLVLAAAMVVLIVATHRAQRLARLQMDFVAGVSHELRTPLTVIASAADNLADGIVADSSHVARYGNAIKEQAEQLKRLVEQILLFAATRDGHYRYHLRPTSTRAIVEAALAQTAELARTAGVKVETDIAPDVPPVLADLSAIAQCLQNLITNAIKYGGEQRWVGVRATAAHGPRGREVQISVADKGMGLRGRELERVFEPFYRGDQAVSAQIHGTGLGLTLARSIAEAMGGVITVRSAPGEGTVFTLHLPATDAAVAVEAEPAALPK